MKEEIPKFITDLSPFEQYRYDKLSERFCAIFKRSRTEAQDYLEKIGLRESEYAAFRYYNQLRLKGFKR